MLKECNMDPNETVQKLFYQDTFHEVKRKRDRRKEQNLVNRESHETLRKPGMQGRGNRGGRGGYYSKYQSHDSVGDNPAKEGEPIGTADKGARITVTPADTYNESETPVSCPEFVIKVSLNDFKGTVPQVSHGGTSLHEDRSAVEGPISNDDEKSEVVIEETADELSTSRALSSETNKVSVKSHSQEMNYLSSSGSKPPSNSGSRLQQVIGPQKAVGPNMEWKPKSTSQIPIQVSASTTAPDMSHANIEKEDSKNSKENSTTYLQQKLEEFQLSESQHVIIPDHLQVPESQRTGLSFGSFDSGYGFGKWSTLPNGSTSENSVLLTESIQGHDEDTGSNLRNQNASSPAQQENPNESKKEAENLQSNESSAPLDAVAAADHEQLTRATILANESSQVSALLAPPLYSAFGLIPPVLSGQYASFEVSEAQTRESSALASFIPFDPSGNYYTQIYQPGTDRDGHFSPYLAPVETKYSGNTATLPTQPSQPHPEPASSPMLPTTGIASSTSQPSGAPNASISQQALSPYRQPASIHMPQYPPNYMPYAHYFSPFYLPTPIHPFFNNPSFAQQPLPSTLYPPSATATTAGSTKYSQYKNSTASSYPSLSSNGPYSSGQPSYNEDPSSTQYKETNVYIPGQQSEGGAAVWIPSNGRDLSGSFYNLSPGQPVNAFGGLYHPTQSLGGASVHPMIQPPLTVGNGGEMAPPPAGVYQQPQQAQMNWAGNY